MLFLGLVLLDFFGERLGWVFLGGGGGELSFPFLFPIICEVLYLWSANLPSFFFTHSPVFGHYMLQDVN